VPERRRWEAVVGAIAALVVTLAVAGALLALGGFDPRAAGVTLLRGAFGSVEALVSITLVRSVPLILTGLAVALAVRAGVWNIGAEGQLYAGAVAGVWVALTLGETPAYVVLPASLLGAMVAGALWAAVPAVMRLRLGVGEVITTILMNFVGIHLAAYMVHGPLQEARGVFFQTDQISEAARLPILVPETRLHIGLAIAVLLAVLLAVVLRWTRIGFQIRAVGASEDAARVAGRIATGRVVLWTFLVSGAIAGLAGAIEVTGVTYALYEGLSPGWGYTAIAVALLAGLDPIAAVATGVLFGALAAGAGALQRDAGIPAVWVGVVEALVILAVLAVNQARIRLHRGRRGALRGLAQPAASSSEARSEGIIRV